MRISRNLLSTGASLKEEGEGVTTPFVGFFGSPPFFKPHIKWDIVVFHSWSIYIYFFFLSYFCMLLLQIYVLNHNTNRNQPAATVTVRFPTLCSMRKALRSVGWSWTTPGVSTQFPWPTFLWFWSQTWCLLYIFVAKSKEWTHLNSFV